MCLKSEVQLLQSVPLFSGIPEARLRKLAFSSELVSFKAGQTILSEADRGQSAYVIVSGEADVYESASNGPAKIGEVGCSSLIGEAAILSDGAISHTVKARTQVDALCISKEHFQALLSGCPRTMGEVVRALSNRIVQPV